jgi:hypothetical protein
MNDFDDQMIAAAEADLQRLLSIEPSRHFAGRVRARIHADEANRSKRWPWMRLALASAAVLTFAVMLATSRQPGGQDALETVEGRDIVLFPERTASNDVAMSSPVLRHTRASRERSAVVTQRPAPTEIIVDPAMADAIRRMAISLRNLQPDASIAEQLQTDIGEAAPLTIAEPLSVPELVLKPADQNGGN